MDETTSVKTCTITGCTNPRHVTKSGRVQTRCTEHMREDQKNFRADPTKPCCHPGCTKPRQVTANGKVYFYCLAHQRQRQREYNEAWRERRSVKPLTQKQSAAGYDRDPQKAIEKNELFKVCLINHDTQTMTFVEGRVTRRCQTNLIDLLPGGWQLLLEGHAKSGWTIVERGARPEVDHA